MSTAKYVLRFFQRRCKHPGEMVAADVLEGCADGVQVKWCRLCGAIKVDWEPTGKSKFTSIEHTWRRPDPFLWSGR